MKFVGIGFEQCRHDTHVAQIDPYFADLRLRQRPHHQFDNLKIGLDPGVAEQFGTDLQGFTRCSTSGGMTNS